jgi:MoaA/NifB/PqqE/SkfB family radical SAM enzyme
MLDDKIMPLVVDWQVTDRCTRDCSFCYGPKSGSGDLTFDQSKHLINKIASIGAKVLGLTGGEALRHNEISQILQYANSIGLKIGLNTNCDLYMLNKEIILKTVSALEVPIENATSNEHDRLRGHGSFQKIIEAVNHVYNNSNIIFRIGTVLLDQSIGDLVKIEKLLSKFKDRIIYWKIYEYIPYSNKEMKTIENNQQKFRELSSLSKKNGLGALIGNDKIIFDSFEERMHSYFLINPLGSVFLPSIVEGKPHEKLLGNLLDDNFEKVIESWKKSVDMIGYTSCKRCIFRKIGYI